MSAREEAERLRQQAAALEAQRHAEEIKELIEDGGGDFERLKTVYDLEREVLDAVTAYREVWGEFTRGQSQADESGSRLDAYIDAHNKLLAATDRLIEEHGKQ
jgi:hypothetical protein